MKFFCELNFNKFYFILNEILFKIILSFFFLFCIANIEFKRIKEKKKEFFPSKIPSKKKIEFHYAQLYFY